MTGQPVTGGGDDGLTYPGQFPPRVPRQLPEALVRLHGRKTELAALDDMLTGRRSGPLVALISGPAGVGKTALAVTWLRQHRDQATDGDLYARLTAVTGLLEAPHEILGRWLRALGMPPSWVPASYPDRIRLWRAVSATRQLAVLIDDVPSADVVTALAPSQGLALVTSRRTLGRGNNDVTRVRVVPLRRRPAARLIASERGDQQAVPERAGELAAACGGLPLALRCAARLTILAGVSAAQLADRLEAEKTQLIRRGVPRTEVRARAAAEIAIGYLRPETAQALQLLALFPGPEIGAGLAAAILRVTPGEAGAVVNTLAGTALLDQRDVGRAQLHSLIQAHAREQIAATTSAAERRAVMGRILTWYAEEASRFEANDRGAAAAAEWIDRNQPTMITVLAAAVDRRENPASAVHLADALWQLLRTRGCYDEQVTVARLGLDAARADRDRPAEARMRTRVGQALIQLGQSDEALDHLHRAAGLWQQLGDDSQLAATNHAYGQAFMALNRPADATTCFTAALTAFENGGQERGTGITLISLGEALTARGCEAEALTRLRQATQMLSVVPDRFNHARAQAALGLALSHDPRSAAVHLQRALEVMRELECLPDQASLLQYLGDLAASNDQSAQARLYYRRAASMLPGTHPASEQLRRVLATQSE